MLNYPTYPPIQQQQRLQYQDPNALKGRLVTSIDEVRATPIDFDGSIFYFPDVTSNRIYTKQINMDGTASFKVYELRATPIEPVMPNTANYITRDEFEAALAQIKQAISTTTKPPVENNIAAQF